jgi:hypothetical protein
MKKVKIKMKKICFIITPIGDANSQTRYRVDQWMELIYKPALGDIFTLIRADKIAATGIITEQILDKIVHADLAIIDYTDLNPNVMYEAAIRHLSRKKFIQIHPDTLRLPFDINNLRSIPYNSQDLDYPTKLRELIRKFYKEMQDPKYKIPELLPVKFDPEQIVKDPVKFVEILKGHLLLTKEAGNSLLSSEQSNIIEVQNEPTASTNNMKTIKCPKCGALQTFPNIPHSTILGILVASPSTHYKCNICGTEFG